MNERKNLDKLFQEKFKDFEAAAPHDAWPYIEEKLKEKKKRRVIPIWWKLSGIAAALLLGFALYDGVFGHADVLDNNLVVRENNDSDASKNQINPENNIPDSSAIANSDSAVATSDSVSPNCHPGENSAPNKKQIAVASKSDTKQSNSIATPINLTTRTPKGQVAVNENKHRESRKNPEGNFGKATSVGKENQLAVNSGQSDKSSKKETAPLKATYMVNKNPLESSETKRQNQSDAPIKNVDSDLKIAQQNHVDAKIGTDNNTSVPASNQQPIADNETKMAGKNPDKKIDSTAIATVVPNALEELLHEKESKLVTKAPKVNRWQITSSVAPIYFGSTSGGSPIDTAFAGNSKSYKTNLSVKLGVNYAINKKFTVRAGVSQVTLDYNTNNVPIYTGFDRNTLGNVNTTNENQFLHFARKASMKNAAAADSPSNLSTDEFSSSVNQRMGYIEVPVELSYAVIDRKFGLNVIGGISTLFLNENKILVVSDGLTTDLGEANNLSKTHFSTNVGLGVKYRFFRAFQANFEPMFKYQLNTFSKDAGNFKPYYFGLYTGVSYSF